MVHTFSRRYPSESTSVSRKNGRVSRIGNLPRALFVVMALLQWVAIDGHTAGIDEQIVEAAKTGDSTRVKNLLAEKLIDAAANGDLAKVKSLLDKGADVNAAPRDGWTALMSAASGRNWQMGTVIPGDYEETALAPADPSSVGGRTEVAKLLIDKGADINAKDKEGCTPLILATKDVFPDLAQALLERGADFNAADNDGWTALMHAAWFDDVNVQMLLLQTSSGGSDRDDAWRKTHSRPIWKRHADLLRRLKACGETLTVAAMLGDEVKAQEIIDAGNDVNARGLDGFTALIGAAAKGHSGVVQILLANGAEVNAKEKNGWTALSQADLAPALLCGGAAPQRTCRPQYCLNGLWPNTADVCRRMGQRGHG